MPRAHFQIRRSRGLVLLASLAIQVAHADERVNLDFGPYRRHYVLHQAAKRGPLVVLLHGWTSEPKSFLRTTEFAEAADRFGYSLAVPEGLNGGWNAGFVDLSGKHQKDVDFVNAVIDDCVAKGFVDPDRIFVVGHSNGAMLTFTVGAKYAPKLAGIVAVSGTVGVKTDKGKWQYVPSPVGKTNVLLIHGKRDPMVAYGSNSNALLQGVGAQDSAKFWAKAFGQESKHRTQTLRSVGTFDIYSDGRFEVRLFSLTNGFHDWPGGKSGRHYETKSGLDATTYICRWIQARRLRGE